MMAYRFWLVHRHVSVTTNLNNYDIGDRHIGNTQAYQMWAKPRPA